MRISVTVKPNARQTLVEPQPDGTFLVSVTAPPAEGAANDAVIEALADHFGIAPSLVRVVKGHTSRRKIVEV